MEKFYKVSKVFSRHSEQSAFLVHGPGLSQNIIHARGRKVLPYLHPDAAYNTQLIAELAFEAGMKYAKGIPYANPSIEDIVKEKGNG